MTALPAARYSNILDGMNVREQRHVPQRDQADVRRGQQCGDLPVRHPGQQGHVPQAQVADAPLQPGLVGALADEREVHGVRGQPGRGLGDSGQPLGDAVRAEVEHQAVTRAGAQAGAHRGIGRP